MVVAAGQMQQGVACEALSQLCQSYWYPLYAYARRRVIHVEDAQDMTQAFFAYLLEKGTVAKADRSRGRFRSFLLVSFNNFLSNQWQKAGAEKRGGHLQKLSLDFKVGESKYQIEPAHELTPEKLFERRWVTTLLDQVLERLRAELSQAGKEKQFERLKVGLAGDTQAIDYQQAALDLGMSPEAAKQAAYRLRKRYRQIFREEVARTVADESEVDEEIGRLLTALRD